MTKPWWAEASGLQIAIATALLLAGFALAWATVGTVAGLHEIFFAAFYAIAGFWVTRRVARALGAALEEAGAEPHGPAVATVVGEAIVLPVYCAIAALIAAIAMTFVSLAAETAFIDAWFATIAVGLAAIVAAIMAAIAVLAIWQRMGSAGPVAATAAQGVGAATFGAAIWIDGHAMRLDPVVDKWYNIPTDPAYLWLIFLGLCGMFGGCAILRLWQQVKGERLVPWMTTVALLVMVGYLAGFARLTGFWASSWLFGAFFILRFTTYGLYLFRPPATPIWRSGWFVSFVASVVLCIVTTVHQVVTGHFGMMMQPALMQPLPLIQMQSTFWTFSLTMTLCLARDLLFLLWLDRVRPGGGGDAIGFGVLIVLYWPLSLLIQSSGWTFLFPVLYPLFADGPLDLLWPVAMIGILVVLIARARRRGLVENPSWA